MNKKLHNKIVDIIGQMIESGNLSEGDRLPSERKLAETHSVSRNTIREAIKTLSEKKILISKLGSGTYVAESAQEILQASINETIDEKRHRLMDIFELRSILEPRIAALAAKRIRQEELNSLADTLDKQEYGLIQGEDTRKHDEYFHKILAKASHNKILFHVYEKLQEVFGESRTDELQSSTRKKASVTIHKEIFNAVKQGDSVKAARCMDKHMKQIRKSLKNSNHRMPTSAETYKG